MLISCKPFGEAHHFNAILGRVVGNFQVTHSFCPHLLVLWSIHPLTEMCKKDFLGCEVRPARRADNCAV